MGASVRVVMAGYEYVSPEQLAGFDKYKVARGPRTPLSLLVPASPRRLRGRRGPCHLVPRGSGQAEGSFSVGPAECWGFGVGERGSILGPPLRLGTLPGDCLFLRRPVDESGAREFPSLLYFVIIIIFSPLRGDAVPFGGVLIVFILMKKFLLGSLAFNFGDGENHLADEARGGRVTAGAKLLMRSLPLPAKRRLGGQ